MKFVKILKIEADTEQKSGLSGNIHRDVHMLGALIEVHREGWKRGPNLLKGRKRDLILLDVGSERKPGSPDHR
jgi:hypothetical protein